MARPFKCPCGATNSVAKGYRRTKTMGRRRIRLCKTCGKKFTPKNQKAIEEAPMPIAEDKDDNHTSAPRPEE